jgi:hypothetical protein
LDTYQASGCKTFALTFLLELDDPNALFVCVVVVVGSVCMYLASVRILMKGCCIYHYSPHKKIFNGSMVPTPESKELTTK